MAWYQTLQSSTYLYGPHTADGSIPASHSWDTKSESQCLSLPLLVDFLQEGLSLACVQTSPLLRKNWEKRLLSRFFPEGGARMSVHRLLIVVIPKMFLLGEAECMPITTLADRCNVFFCLRTSCCFVMTVTEGITCIAWSHPWWNHQKVETGS